ncbi:hypothetical protein D9M72_490620 [compost metagenome]
MAVDDVRQPDGLYRIQRRWRAWHRGIQVDRGSDHIEHPGPRHARPGYRHRRHPVPPGTVERRIADPSARRGHPPRLDQRRCCVGDRRPAQSGPGGRRCRVRACPETWRDRRDVEGLAGPRTCLLRGAGRAIGEGPAGGPARKGGADAADGTLGVGCRLPGAEPPALSAEGSHEARPHRGGGPAAPRRPADGQAGPRRNGEILQADRSHPLCHRPRTPDRLRDGAGKGGWRRPDRDDRYR